MVKRTRPLEDRANKPLPLDQIVLRGGQVRYTILQMEEDVTGQDGSLGFQTINARREQAHRAAPDQEPPSVTTDIVRMSGLVWRDLVHMAACS